MVSKLTYTEDEEDLFEVDEFFQYKMQKCDVEVIDDVITQIVENIHIMPRVNGTSTVCGKTKNGNFFKLTYIKYDDDIHIFTDFELIEVDEFLDAINSNQSFNYENVRSAITNA
jgi:hypothetical protein